MKQAALLPLPPSTPSAKPRVPNAWARKRAEVIEKQGGKCADVKAGGCTADTWLGVVRRAGVDVALCRSHCLRFTGPARGAKLKGRHPVRTYQLPFDGKKGVVARPRKPRGVGWMGMGKRAGI